MFGQQEDPSMPGQDNSGSSSSDDDSMSQDHHALVDHMQPIQQESESASIPDDHAQPTNEANDLLDIKMQVLEELSPLVNQLDQSPDDKFHTIMMMIQASDDRSLVKSAYDVAKQITDEKERAQALLDIVNEINYFTQNDTK